SAFLSGITLHHADTVSHTYARQPLSSASSASASSSQSWRPLGNASSGGVRGGGGGSGSSVAASTTIEEVEDDAAPRVDTYDKASGEGEDERELLDAAPHGTLGLQRLPPPPTASITSKLAKDLEASLRSEYSSFGRASLTASSMPVPIPPPQTSISSRSRNRGTAASTSSGGGGRSARTSSPSSTLSSVPLIDFHQSSESASKFPIPSAPIYQSQAPQPRNPYFQAAWNAWMHQSVVSPTGSATAPHMTEDVDRICRLFNATTVAPPTHQQCEREVLVGAASSTNLNPFLSPQSSCLSEPSGQSTANIHQVSGKFTCLLFPFVWSSTYVSGLSFFKFLLKMPSSSLAVVASNLVSGALYICHRIYSWMTLVQQILFSFHTRTLDVRWSGYFRLS
ncbi:hypothetical protein TSMEX_005764, partial [Taenia solium]